MNSLIVEYTDHTGHCTIQRNSRRETVENGETHSTQVKALLKEHDGQLLQMRYFQDGNLPLKTPMSGSFTANFSSSSTKTDVSFSTQASKVESAASTSSLRCIRE